MSAMLRRLALISSCLALVLPAMMVNSGNSLADGAATESLVPADPPEVGMFAEAWGVSEDDASKQLAAQDDAGRLQATLLDAEGDVFGGMWIDHDPSFQIVVRALPGSEARIQPYIDQARLTAVTRIEAADYTFQQLEKDQASLNALIPARVNFASGIDISLGRVEVWVDNPADAAALATSGLPESTVVVVRGLPIPSAQPQIQGGLTLFPCGLLCSL